MRDYGSVATSYGRLGPFFCFDMDCKVSQSQKEPVLPVVALTENGSNGNGTRLLLNLEQVTKLGISGGLQQQR